MVATLGYLGLVAGLLHWLKLLKLFLFGRSIGFGVGAAFCNEANYQHEASIVDPFMFFVYVSDASDGLSTACRLFAKVAQRSTTDIEFIGL